MHDKKYIHNLLKKFVKGECNEVETSELVEFFKNEGHTEGMPPVEDFLNILEEQHELDPVSADRIYQRIIATTGLKTSETESYTPSRRRQWWPYAAAVAAVILVFGGYLVRQNLFSTHSASPPVSQVDNEIIVPEQEAITLQRENGDIEIIQPDGSSQVVDASGKVIGQQNGEVLTYQGNSTQSELVYNTLNVPYGKRFEVVLADGSSVHINAGSSLKYPVSFPAGETTRQVFITGEAYFDVAHDSDHPFVVNTGELDVQVLGTSFNVSNYPEDDATNVVLLEGSVQLNPMGDEKTNQKPFLLKPGEKGQFEKSGHHLSSQQVNTSIYIAWIKGELVFRDMAFEDMLKKLERHYNISIINHNKELAGEKFNASFGNEPVEKVFSYLETIYGIHYTVKNNQVILN